MGLTADDIEVVYPGPGRGALGELAVVQLCDDDIAPSGLVHANGYNIGCLAAVIIIEDDFISPTNTELLDYSKLNARGPPLFALRLLSNIDSTPVHGN